MRQALYTHYLTDNPEGQIMNVVTPVQLGKADVQGD